MDLKEAEEIIRISSPTEQVYLPICRAEALGFINGWHQHEEKVKALIEALESIIKHSQQPFVSVKWSNENRIVAEEALEAYRQSEKEEK